MSHWLWRSFNFFPPVFIIRGVLPSPDFQIKAFQRMTLSVRSSSILIHLLPPKAKAALTRTRPELKVRKDLWMYCSGRHRVRLYSYRYLKLAPRPGAYRVELRRSECHLLCWSQYLSVVGNYPRQTASCDKQIRKIHHPFMFFSWLPNYGIERTIWCWLAFVSVVTSKSSSCRVL